MMRKKKGLWTLALIAIAIVVFFDIVTASRWKRPKLAVDAVTMATPLTNSTVGVVRSDNTLLTDPVSPTADFNYQQVKDMVWKAIELAPTKTGPLPSIIPKGSWVVVYPNMVFMKTQADYSLGDITDPRVTKAVLEYVAEKSQASRITLAMGGSWRGLDGQPDSRDGGPQMQNGVQVDGFTCTWGNDYPGFDGSFQDVLNELSSKYPAKVFDKKNFNYDVYPSIEKATKVPVPVSNGIGGWSVDSYYVSNTILNCDVFINVAAMKVHNIAKASLIHKNYMGTASRVMYGVAGWWLGDLHSQPGGPDAVFSDLFSYHPTDYAIIGGAWGMEGKGPHITQGGKPIRTNMVIAGPDPVATDAVAATIMGFNPWDIEYLHRSEAKGYGTFNMDYITVRGDAIDKVKMNYAKPAIDGTGLTFYYGRGNRVWLVNGVFNGVDLEQDFLNGEANIQPYDGESSGGQVWTKLINSQDMIDLKNYFYEKLGSYQTNVVSYAFTYISSKTDQSGSLWVGADDGIKIWLNGELVLANPNTGSHKFAAAKVPIVLKAGENRLLAKIKNTVGNYAFSVAVVDEGGNTLPGIYYHTEVVTSVAEATNVRGKPGDFALMQNYPNPFNSSTTIRFALSKAGNVDLSVYDIQGRRIRKLSSGEQNAGYRSVLWDGKDETGREVASGIYLYRLKVGSFTAIRKAQLLR